MTKNNSIKVLFAASEAEPFYKVGGLGDYAGSLPNALKNYFKQSGENLDIRVVLPLHDRETIPAYQLQKLFPLFIDGKENKNKCDIYETTYGNIQYYFIRQVSPRLEFDAVYGHDQYLSAYKFALFSMAAIKMLEKLDWKPDIIHTNDWHTALMNHLIKKENKSSHRHTRTILTIHNMPFMGYGSEPLLEEFRIETDRISTFPTWARNLPLPMGIAASDSIVAVSPSYAKELTTNDFAYGLEKYFIAHPEKLNGIINGIDYQKWDPKSDTEIFQQFSKSNLGLRKINKKELYKEIGFEIGTNEPLLVVISRLDNQKGIDLILDTLTKTAEWNWKAVILGSGHHGYEYAFRALERVLPNKIHAALEYNPSFAKKLYAAGDMILMPSLYEPCGLSQMIAMRYGCVPIAHAVGGLKDSIVTKPESKRTGFLFKPATDEAFIASLKKAIQKYSQKDAWELIQRNGMKKDFSWLNSAANYANIYKYLLLLK